MQLNTEQRLDMVQKGLSPLNEEHVKKYIENGGMIRASMKDTQERLKTLIGENAYGKVNLGGAGETEQQYVQAMNGGEYTSNDVNVTNEKSIRERMTEDLNTYYDPTSTRLNSINLNSNRLMSLNKRERVMEQKNIGKEEALKIQSIGYQTCIKYLNAFIINIKTPSYENRKQLYDCLFKVLKNDEKVQGNEQKMKYYRSGCKKAEEEMYAKLKNIK